MSMLSFAIEWAARSAVLVAGAWLILRLLTVKSATVRLMVWTTVLLGSLSIPFLRPILPPLGLPMTQVVRSAPQAAIMAHLAAPASSLRSLALAPKRAGLDWLACAQFLYAFVAAALLFRLALGLLLSQRFVRRSDPIPDLEPGGQAFRECAAISVPVTIGFHRPVVLLPSDWQAWEEPKLQAVLAHEMSHVRRRDPFTQLVSSIHRSLLWFSPLSWWLHSRLVRTAEEASDDAAIVTTPNRAYYAEVLLSFLRLSPHRIHWEGVAMARYGSADQRIQRILDGEIGSRRLTKLGAIAVVVLAVPLLYVVAAARPAAQAAAPRAPLPPIQASQAVLAAPAPPEPEAELDDHDSYCIVSDDNTSINGSVDDLGEFQRLRSQLKQDFVWFRHDGKEFLIRDAQTVARAKELFAPQEELGRKQEELGKLQEELGEKQSALGDRMSEIRTTLPDLTRELHEIEKRLKNKSQTQEELGDLEAAIGELQSKISENQSNLGEEQSKLGEEQAALGEKQGELGEQQGKLGEEQGRIAEEATRKLRKIIDECMKNGLAKPYHRTI